jgi:N utilization substance protein A
MNFDLSAILNQIGRDKGIDKQLLIEAVESAMLSAAKKHYGHNLALETKFNEDTSEIEVVRFKTVVENVEDTGTQLSVEEARRDLDPEAMVGDSFGEKLDTTALGRIAAQTAKQVIIQKMRDAERGVIFEEYKGQKGEIVNGIVQRYEHGNLIVNLGRTDAVVPKREQILREKYRQGDRVRALILDIDRTARGPQIILTRSHPDFLKKLFGNEVPEIGEGVIEIKFVAREPGERAKIAVTSSDSDIDPVGACVGVKGTRVQAVVQELRGERIDIIPWTPDEPSFVARALSPAEVNRVVVKEEDHAMEVIVADDQLSLAIGRRGTNVKLASRLTGWKLDVRSEAIAEEESKRAREALESIPGVDFAHAGLLFAEGYRHPREVAAALVEEIASIEGIGPETAEKIVRSSQELVEKLDSEETTLISDPMLVSDIGRLLLAPELKERLIKGGFRTIQSIVEAEPATLIAGASLDENDLETIREATDTFLRVPARNALI